MGEVFFYFSKTSVLGNTSFTLDIYIDSNDTLLAIHHHGKPIRYSELARTLHGSTLKKYTHASSHPITQALDQYIQGKSRDLSVPYTIVGGTPFQQKVWKFLSTIPYGEVVSYQQIAIGIAHPKAVRAVGSAVGDNPLSLVIPCHRVIPHASLKKHASHHTITQNHIGMYHGGSLLKYTLLMHETHVAKIMKII